MTSGTRAAALALLGLFAAQPAWSACKSERSDCEPGERAPCACADGTSGERGCLRGTFGRCSCEEARDDGDGGKPATTGPLDFGNPDAAAPAPTDASFASDPDARVIEVDTTCGQQESQAVIAQERPVDVIFIIDNSGSMSTEIEAVERNISDNFAQIIEASGADYRVILLTDHGSDSLDVCVDLPLSSLPCSESTNPSGPTMGAPANGPRFFHYDINVQSLDSVCLALRHYRVDPVSGPRPETGQAAAPTGWNEWLREDALKVFVEISDDRLSCRATDVDPVWDFTPTGPDAASATRLARNVYAAIQSLSSAQFGTPAEPKFIWHSIVGIVDNDPVELPYTHFDPPRLSNLDRCSTASNPGPAYQMLSISTGGLRYPVCAADNGFGYDSVFRAIAHEVVRGARVECAFNIPTPPPEKFIDYKSVVVEYTPGDGGDAETFERVLAEDCDDRSFYFDESEIKLCPAACTRVRADDTAKVGVVFGCGPEVVFDPDVL